MGKLYYTDPLQAAYMAKEFGVDFIIKWWGEEIIAKHSDAIKQPKQFVANMIMKHKAGKFCIHPDSYHIFEPQVGDLVLFGKYNNHYGIFKPVAPEYADNFKLIPIIQRNNKPFFNPEKED